MPKDANIRKKCCKTMRRKNGSCLSSLYCCEDHLNEIENDTENYMKYKVVALEQEQKVSLLLKKRCYTTYICQCQENKLQPSPDGKNALKRKRLARVEEAVSEADIKLLNYQGEKMPKSPKCAEKEELNKSKSSGMRKLRERHIKIRKKVGERKKLKKERIRENQQHKVTDSSASNVLLEHRTWLENQVKTEEITDDSTLSCESLPSNGYPLNQVKMEDIEDTKFSPSENLINSPPHQATSELPTNVNFVGVLNCAERRLYPTPPVRSSRRNNTLVLRPRKQNKEIEASKFQPIKQYFRKPSAEVKKSPVVYNLNHNDVIVELVQDSDEEEEAGSQMVHQYSAATPDCIDSPQSPTGFDRLGNLQDVPPPPNLTFTPQSSSSFLDSSGLSPERSMRIRPFAQFPALPHSVRDEPAERTTLTIVPDTFNDVEEYMLPPMPRLIRRPREEDPWQVEYLEEENAEELYHIHDTVISRKIQTKHKWNDNKQCNESFPKKSSSTVCREENSNNEIRISVDSLAESVDSEIFEIDNVTSEMFVFPPARRKSSRGEPTSRCEAEPEYVKVEHLALMLKQSLKDPWTVVLTTKSLQVLRVNNSKELPNIAIGLVISFSGSIAVYVAGKRLSKKHSMWTSLSEPVTLSNFLRIGFVLQIVAWLHSQQVCEALEKGEAYSSACEMMVLRPLRRCVPCRIYHCFSKSGPKDKIQHHNTPIDNLIPLPTECVEKLESKSGRVGELFAAMRATLATEFQILASEEGTGQKIPVTQEEVLGSMGLQRRDSADRPLRKSKREKKTSLVVAGARAGRREELEFLTRNWDAVEALFSENLHFGTYTSMGTKKLADGYKRTFGLLQRWHRIIGDNPGFLSDVTVAGTEEVDVSSMPVEDLRRDLQASVQEINKLKRKFKSISPFFNKLIRSELKIRATKELEVLLDE